MIPFAKASTSSRLRSKLQSVYMKEICFLSFLKPYSINLRQITTKNDLALLDDDELSRKDAGAEGAPQPANL